MTRWIIVVDDDTANLQMAGHILSKNNMRVTALRSGALLLDYIKDKGVPDLILLDILMPEMDKADLFPSIIRSGPLPKKSFSIGPARDKRYYLECRRLRP